MVWLTAVYRLLTAVYCLLFTGAFFLDYFRHGFERGYEDGYYSRNQYGRYANGTGSILGTILEAILNLQLLN